MTDINKQIEEEAREYAIRQCVSKNLVCVKTCSHRCAFYSINNMDELKQAYKIGYQTCLTSKTKDIQYIEEHYKDIIAEMELAQRWRKVSEGMPEKRQQVIAKCECGNLEFSYYGEHSKRIMCDCEGCDNIVEWKPID